MTAPFLTRIRRFRRHGRSLTALFLGLLLLQGCAAPRIESTLPHRQRPDDSLRFFSTLDTAVQREAVGDAAAFRLEGFPYLRTNRFLAAMGSRLETADQQRAWLKELRRLDRMGREKEIRNLPEDALNRLLDRFRAAGRKDLMALAGEYGDRLLETEAAIPGVIPPIADAARGNSEYSLFLRVAGLYPVAALPVTLLTHKAQREFRGWHRTPPGDLPVRGNLIIYVPPITDTAGPIAFQRDSLGRILLDPAQTRRLVNRFAPILRQDTVDVTDRPGRIHWQGETVSVDPDSPTAYVYLTHAFFGEIPALQINYVFWYKARTGPQAPLIERGHLDGMTIQVSLAPDGRPFMVNIMNNCGCYQQSFPNPDFIEGVAPQPLEIDAFVPADLPPGIPPRHISLRVNSGWHQVQQVVSEPIPDRGILYDIRPYSELESLPRDGGRFESIFTPDGIVKGSGRIEPYILFSMGIPDIGSMRQRGHHATRLVGREHYDDPEVFNRNFIFRQPEAAP
jgi:hypothetical protein